MECLASNIVQTVRVKLGCWRWNHADKELIPLSFANPFPWKCVKAKRYWPKSTGFGLSFILDSHGIPIFPRLSPDTGKTPNLSILPSGSLFSKINVGLTLRTTSSNLNFGITWFWFKIFPWGSPRMKYKLHGTIRNLHYMVTILPSGHNAHDCKRQVPYSNITKHFFAPKLLWVSFRLALHFFYCSHLKCPLPPSPKSHHPVCLLQIPSPAALTGPLLLWNSVMFVIMIIGRTLFSQPGQTVLGNRLCFKSLLFSVTCNTMPHNTVSKFLT